MAPKCSSGPALCFDGFATHSFVSRSAGSQGVILDAAANGPLSQARAETARNYWVESHGIPSARLEATGYGTEDPLRKVEQTA